MPRSTLAQWVGQTGVQLQALVDALREAVLAQRVHHTDRKKEDAMDAVIRLAKLADIDAILRFEPVFGKITY
ncbi:transposase [Pseudomonas marginalis]|nr:transposase [Pseudomonas marginalis]WPN26752.1 transposase [Pseudomonas marginalis]